MRGWDVAVLQFLLARHRLLHGPPDGIFGEQTQAALVRFQNARGLEPDGVVGPATAAALCRLAACSWAGHVVSAAPVTPASVQSLIDRWSASFGVDRHLVRGIAWQESGYQPSVVSAHGAVGVMQLMPKTWVFVETSVIGHQVPATVEGNIEVGVAYVHYLLGRFGGDTATALAAYNQGPASVETVGILPATQVYVDDVLALARRL
jgi:soluble lytic murein transglycosylase-like protein